MLPDFLITQLAKAGVLELSPFNEKQVQPASYDVTLGEYFSDVPAYGVSIIDPLEERNKWSRKPMKKRLYSLAPGGFVLGHTEEIVGLPADICARFEGKSTLGRLGLMPHVAAGFVDPGFRGQLTLELHNVSSCPILLTPGMRIGQLCFMKMYASAKTPYGSDGLGSHYQNQTTVTSARTTNELD
jgi:dCTP deaminase